MSSRELIDMEPQLLLEFLFDVSTPEQRTKAQPQRRQPARRVLGL
jgi:hypothetical protein